MPTMPGLADRIFLLQESLETPQHIAGLGTFQIPEDAASNYVALLAEQFRSTCDFATPFDLKLRRPSLKSVAPSYVQVDPEEIDLDHHFRHSALPHPGGERELGVLVSRLHSHALPASRG